MTINNLHQELDITSDVSTSFIQHPACQAIWLSDLLELGRELDTLPNEGYVNDLQPYWELETPESYHLQFCEEDCINNNISELVREIFDVKIITVEVQNKIDTLLWWSNISSADLAALERLLDGISNGFIQVISSES